ncbi:MAG: dihydrolipoyl dehydrogenase [Bacteroidales bacterium]|nr:dihydrolipoyl dehydrogenase [Bacteroidales bacterium]
MKYNLAIIGGGPAGYAAAERAGKKGLSVVIFEKKELGGVCLNEGCIPTKTLLYSAKVYDNSKSSEKYGITNTGTSFDLKAIIRRKDKVVRKLVGGVAVKMKYASAVVVKESACLTTRDAEGVHLMAGNAEYIAENVLICTGSEAVIPPIPGMDAVSNTILTNREILELEELPESLVIIGGGVIGMEFASFYNSLGVKVTVIEMLEKILGEMDAELSAMLQESYQKKGVDIHLQAKVVEVKGNKIFYEKDGQRSELQAGKILMSVGRRAVTEGLGLETLGVELQKGGIKVDEQMRTNVPNLYAAGDVTGFSLLAHTAYREAEVVVNNLTGQKDTMRYGAIPSVVYTNPEFAGVGHTEKTAKAAGIDFKVAQLPMAYAGRFIAENEGGSGVCKVLVGARYGEILGVHMLGNPASEMIYGAAMAIENEMTLRELEEVVFPHPTVSEIFKETIFSF